MFTLGTGEGLARFQHSAISRGQLLGAGVTSRRIRLATERGELIEHHRGVFRPAGAPVTWQFAAWAAVLAVGEPAALNAVSAASLMGVWDVPPVPHICVPFARRANLTAVAVHRSRLFDADDVNRIEGLPVTGALWTLYDCAEILSFKRLVLLADRFITLGFLDPADLSSSIGRFKGRHGLKYIRPYLEALPADAAAKDSAVEMQFQRLVEGSELPPPLHHAYVATPKGSIETDFYWPDHGLVVETDGTYIHLQRDKQRRDRVRDAALAAVGIRTIRFDETDVYDTPARTLALLTDALGVDGRVNPNTRPT